nr:MAG TPA: hypothetical protein [Caudoviricetes sp.]
MRENCVHVGRATLNGIEEGIDCKASFTGQSHFDLFRPCVTAEYWHYATLGKLLFELANGKPDNLCSFKLVAFVSPLTQVFEDISETLILFAELELNFTPPITLGRAFGLGHEQLGNIVIADGIVFVQHKSTSFVEWLFVITRIVYKALIAMAIASLMLAIVLASIPLFGSSSPHQSNEKDDCHNDNRQNIHTCVND